MRRTYLVPCAVLAGLLASRGAMAQTADTVTARVGGGLTGFLNTSLTVPVVVDMSKAGGEKLGSYTGRLSWNPAVLNCYNYYYQCGFSAGSFPQAQLNTDSLAQGVVRFSAVSPLGASGVVTLAQFQFQITDTTTSALGLSFSEMSAAGTFTNLQAYLTVSGGTFCQAVGRWGDLDGDGAANSRDALGILSNLVGLPVDTTVFKLFLGDADGDALVNSRDALIILSYGVGLDISGQRVLLAAPKCAATTPRQVSVFPAAASLGPSQTLQLFVQGTDSAGRTAAVPTATWRSSDYTVATVDAAGLVTPRGAGTVTITAEVSPGLHASAAITVLPQRGNWYVDLKATGAALELGTLAAPFEHPAQAFAVATEGDTIRVAPGTYFWTVYSPLNVGVVLIGGTPGDTTTRPVFRDPQNYNTAIEMDGGQRTLVRNVVFQNFYYAADLNGVHSFAVEDSKFVLDSTSYGYGIYSCAGDVDSVRVDRSTFLGNSAELNGYGVELDGCGRVGLLTFRDSQIRFLGYGVYLYEVDSAAVIRSEISDNGGYGIYASEQSAARPALYVAHSRLERNYYNQIYADYMRRLAIDTSVVRDTSSYSSGIIAVYGDYSSGPAQVYFQGDSLYLEGNAQGGAWLTSAYVDTLVVNETVVRLPADTSFYTYNYIYADKAFVTNSKFLNLGNGSAPFYFYGSQALVDNVDMTGCAVANCDGAYGVQLYQSTSLLNSEVRNARFTQVRYPVNVSATHGTNLVHGLQMDSVATGVYVVGGDSTAAYGNVLSRVTGTGILVNGSGVMGASVNGNSITCSAAALSHTGISVDNGRMLAQGNTVTGCYWGITLGATGRMTAAQNTIRGGTYGVNSSYTTDTTASVLRANGISGTATAALWIGGRPNVRVVGNNVQNNLLDGLYEPYSTNYTTVADSNAFVGNARYGVYAPSSAVDARYNWWGASGGAGSPGADSVSGQVDASSPLTTAPPGLPGLAPPMVAAWAWAPSATLTTASVTPPTASSSVPVPQPPARVAKPPRAVPTFVMRPGMPPALMLRVQQQAERRAAHEALTAQRDAARAARIQADRARAQQGKVEPSRARRPRY